MIAKPSIFYKYHTINQYLFDLLSDNSFWFSKREYLNDPYDCKYSFSEKLTNEILYESVEGMMQDLVNLLPFKATEMTKEGLEHLIDIFTKGNRESFSDRLIEGLVKNSGFGHGICCFTTTNVNELMWSHYANSYKGVCLGFDLENEKIFPIKYSDVFPVINSIDEINEAIFSKRLCWKYEEEWRMITSGIYGKVKFNKVALKSITFGSNTSDEDKIRIMNILDENKYKDVMLNTIFVNKSGIEVIALK